MTHDAHLEHLGQPPVWFRAPESWTEMPRGYRETCKSCGCEIRPGEIIAEVDGDGMEFVHEACCEMGESQ